MPANAKCSFCGKSREQVNTLIAAPGVYICDECVNLCCEILTEESEGAFGWIKKPEPPAKEWPKPRSPAQHRFSIEDLVYYNDFLGGSYDRESTHHGSSGSAEGPS